MRQVLVAIRDLQVIRGHRTVLTVDELGLEKGEVLAVVGPNGAGKSTLLLVLARLLSPQRGEIWFNGRSVQTESVLAYRRRIALVLQDPLLFDMSVYDNVAAGLRFRGVPRDELGARVDIWLARLGILALKDRRATELSGGEAQRVSLARALAVEPDLLLLDEPFSALDPPTRKRLSAEFASLLAETQTTAVFVTHDLPEAIHLGQRVALIANGRLQQVGRPDEMRQSANEPELLAFLQA